MAVDSNIIIFERVREERAQGRSIIQSLDSGFRNAVSTIVDANVTTFIVAGSGTFASLDAFLALFLAGVMASYYCALRETCPWRRRGYLVLCGMSCAGALLAKGFLALAIPVVVVAPYIVVRRRWRAMIGSAWVPLAVTAALVLPWAVAIHLREPDFWRYFFWIEHIQRFMGDQLEDVGMIATGLMIAIIPVILIYAFFSERLIQGMTAGAVK
jgi:4-amino-4-deoxy-L-arabinose transferase-like glycosyltransferase